MRNLIFNRFTGIVTLLALLLVGCDPSGGPTTALDDSGDVLGKKFKAASQPAYSGTFGDLVAGQHTKVGTVEVNQVGDLITVTFNTEGGSCMTETHVYIGEEPPSKPYAPGQFDYGNDALSCVTGWTMPTGVDIGGWQDVYIAAHAVVESGVVNTETISASWEDPVTVQATQPGANSYFDATISNWGDMSGVYPAWCIDLELSLDPSVVYLANAYSSYDTNDPPTGLVEIPENLDLINYILNNPFVGEESSAFGAFTYGDVQRAIWQLIDDPATTQTGGIGDHNLNRIQEIIDDATSNGDGFEPGCGQVYGVILEPFDPVAAQYIIIPKPVPCDTEGDETAWGFGYVGGNDDPIAFDIKWGWYFEYTPVL